MRAGEGVDSGDRLSFLGLESLVKRRDEPPRALPVCPQPNPWTLPARVWTLPTTIHKRSMDYEGYPVDSAGQIN